MAVVSVSVSPIVSWRSGRMEGMDGNGRGAWVGGRLGADWVAPGRKVRMRDVLAGVPAWVVEVVSGWGAGRQEFKFQRIYPPSRTLAG